MTQGQREKQKELKCIRFHLWNSQVTLQESKPVNYTQEEQNLDRAEGKKSWEPNLHFFLSPLCRRKMSLLESVAEDVTYGSWEWDYQSWTFWLYSRFIHLAHQIRGMKRGTGIGDLIGEKLVRSKMLPDGRTPSCVNIASDFLFKHHNSILIQLCP